MSFWEKKWAGLAAVATALVLYVPSIVFGRVWLDDYWLWGDDSPLRHVNGHVLHDVFFELAARHPYGGEYLPVRDLVVAGDMAVWGDNVHGPHITQWLLFGLVAWLFGTLLVRWGVGKRAAWLATILWIAHPVCVQSVAWISERKGMLAAVFVLLCGHAWVRFRDDKASPLWLVASVLCAVLGVWSKAPAMFAVAAFGAWDLLLLKPARRRWIQIIAVGVATALAAAPVVLVASQTHVMDEGTVVEFGRAARSLGALGHYTAGLVLARQPALSYPMETDGPGALDLALGAVAIVGSLVLVWRRRGDRLTMAGLAWMWIWFVPFSQLVTPVHILVADRYAFLLTAGGGLLAALALDRLSGIVRTAAMAALVGVLALCTVRAEGPWASSDDLFTAAVASNPRDWKNYQDLAISLSSEGQPEDALRAVEAGLVVLPDDIRLQLQRSDLLWQLGDHEGSLAAARHAADTGSKAAASGYAKRLLDSGRPDEALPWAEGAAKAHPENERYQQTLAEVCVTLGRWSCAEQALRTAVAIPDHQPSDAVLLERVRAQMKAAPSATTPSTNPANVHQGL